MKKLIPAFVSWLFIFSSCHKDESPNTYTNVVQTSPLLVDGSVPSNAAGVFFACYVVYHLPGDTSSDITAGASFFNDSAIHAGPIIANGDTLGVDSVAPGFTNYISCPSNAVAWNIHGNIGGGIPAINYTDNTPFPIISGVSLPSSINAQSGLTIHYVIAGAYDSIFYGIYGLTIGNSYSGGSATSVSFSTSQIRQAVPANGYLNIQIFVEKLTPYVVAGDTFYFEKAELYQTATSIE